MSLSKKWTQDNVCNDCGSTWALDSTDCHICDLAVRVLFAMHEGSVSPADVVALLTPLSSPAQVQGLTFAPSVLHNSVDRGRVLSKCICPMLSGGYIQHDADCPEKKS